MSKDIVRMLFLQIAALVGIFGFMSPRLMAAAQLLQVLATQHWDQIWAIISSANLMTNKQLKANPNGQPDPYEWVDQIKP